MPLPSYDHLGGKASEAYGVRVMPSGTAWIWSPPPAPSTDVAELAVADVAEVDAVAESIPPDTDRDGELSIELVAGVSMRRRRWMWLIGQMWLRIHVRRRR
jgi:hypothetical protein